MLGLIGVALGLPWADTVAGLVGTGFICHVGYEVTKDLLPHLMDSVDSRCHHGSRKRCAGRVWCRTRLRTKSVDGSTLLIEVEGFGHGSLKPGTVSQGSGQLCCQLATEGSVFPPGPMPKRRSRLPVTFRTIADGQLVEEGQLESELIQLFVPLSKTPPPLLASV